MMIKKIVLAFLGASLFLVACRNPQGEERKMYESRLEAIDDSIASQSPGVRQMIVNQMKNAHDSISYYEAYVRMAKYYCLSATPDSMAPFVEGTIRFAKSQPETPRLNRLLAFAYNTKAANLHNFHQNDDEAISLYQEACRLLLQSDDKSDAPKVCANLGDAYMYKNQLPEAASCYRRALFLVDSLGLPSRENITLYLGLASIYQQLNDFKTSLKYYQQTERHFDEMSVNMRAYFLNNYGNYYYYSKDYAKSLGMFLRLKAMLEKYGKTDTFDMFLCKLNMADVYLNLGQVALSEKYLDEVEPYMQKNADDVAMYYCHTIRIGQAVKKQDMNAVSVILASEKKMPQVAFSLRQIRNHYLREYYKVKGDYRLAYDNLHEDVAMNDSLEHNRVNMRASEIMDRFTQDTLRLHHNLEMEHKNAEVLHANVVAIAAIALVLLAVLLFVLKVVQSRRRMETDKVRIMQLKMAAVRNRISPHFVFNVLNNKIVGSDDQEADELMELTKLIRTNLDMSCRLDVTLGEELEFVKQYVEIERHFVGDDFKFVVDLAPGLEPDVIHVPSMFVQILVENAFVHGLKGWEGSKLLTVKVSRELDGTTVISVCDNGPGFDIRSVGKKRTGLNVISQTIAMVNEYNRSKMAFSLHNLTDQEGKVTGCEATLRVPDNVKLFKKQV